MTSGARTLIWTRAVADWASDARLLRAVVPRDVALMHLPCLKTEALSAKAPAGPFDAAILLSPNAVQYAKANAALFAALKTVKAIYTHGATTADTLRALGLPAIHLASAKTALDVGTWLGGTLATGTRVLWPTAAEPSHDLAQSLGAQGIPVTRVDVYRTLTGAERPDGAALAKRDIETLTRETSGVVTFASPSAARGFLDVFAPKASRLKDALTAVSMGTTTAKAVDGHFARHLAADVATLDGLIAKSVEALLA